MQTCPQCGYKEKVSITWHVVAIGADGRVLGQTYYQEWDYDKNRESKAREYAAEKARDGLWLPGGRVFIPPHKIERVELRVSR